MADNWYRYPRISLTTRLQSRNIDYCGNKRKNRSRLPHQIKSAMLKKREVVGAINTDGDRVLKFIGKSDLHMISTFHEMIRGKLEEGRCKETLFPNLWICLITIELRLEWFF